MNAHTLRVRKCTGRLPAGTAGQFALGAIVLCVLCGCVSTFRPGGKKGELQGMLYDFDNCPIAGYCVQVDESVKTFTDINGRFSLPGVAYGVHTVRGSGEKHLDFEQEYQFSDKTEILHIRIPSYETTWVLIDTALEARNIPEAQRLLAALPNTEQDTLPWRLYHAIACYLEAGPVEGDCWLEQAERISASIGGKSR